MSLSDLIKMASLLNEDLNKFDVNSKVSRIPVYCGT